MCARRQKAAHAEAVPPRHIATIKRGNTYRLDRRHAPNDVGDDPNGWRGERVGAVPERLREISRPDEDYVDAGNRRDRFSIGGGFEWIFFPNFGQSSRGQPVS